MGGKDGGLISALIKGVKPAVQLGESAEENNMGGGDAGFCLPQVPGFEAGRTAFPIIKSQERPGSFGRIVGRPGVHAARICPWAWR